MKPSFVPALLASVLLALTTHAQTQTQTQLLPLVLDGYNAGVIASGTFTDASSVQSTTTTSIDSSFDYYAKGFNPGDASLGLPAGNTFTSAANPNAIFLIQPAGTAADGTLLDNVMLLVDQSDGQSSGTFTLTYPGTFNTLAVLVTGLESSNPVGYALQFTDGTVTQGTFVAPDNYLGFGQVALAGFGRVARLDGIEMPFETDDGLPGNPPRLYEADLPLSPTDAQRTLASITFTNLCPGPYLSVARKVAIFGVSGYSSTPSLLAPIALTGFNQDVVADPGYSAADSTTATLDSAFVYYVPGFNPDNLGLGLPAGANFVSAANPNTLFYLQPSGGSDTPINPDGNALLVNVNGTITLPAPAAYSRLAILSAGYNGDVPLQYQLNFSDGGSATVGQLTSVDNFFGDAPVALLGFGRVERDSGEFDTSTQDETFPRIYETDLTLSDADALRPLASIDFTNVGATSLDGIDVNAAIFALSGTATATAPTGTLAFAAPSYTVRQDAGAATITVNRSGGSTGALSVNYATADGSALANLEYTPVSGTLAWDNGDTTPRTFQVPILTTFTPSDSVRLLVNLVAADGGSASTLGSPSQASVDILPVTAPVNPIQELDILSPPAGLSVVQTQAVELYLSVQATDGAAYQVALSYSDDATGAVTPLETFTSARNRATWVPPQPGNFHLIAEATQPPDATVLSRTSLAITVVAAASSTDTGPLVSLDASVGDSQYAAGEQVTLTASAVDSDGTPLSSVQFYADGTLLGTAPVVTSSARGPAGGKHIKDAGSALNGAFATLLVSIGQSVQVLTAVGTNSRGVSGVSSSVTIYTKSAQTTDLVCTITSPANNTTLPANSSTQTATVTASNSTGTVAQVELFLDKNSIGVVKAGASPFSFTLPPLGAGDHTLSAIATDGNALSKTSDVVFITAELPVVTVGLVGAGTAVEGGAKAKAVVTRTGDTSAALTVYYKVKGSAEAGVDYKELSGSVIIPVGETTANIKVKPIDNATVDGTRRVKIVLKDDPNNQYTVGSPAVAKVKILDND